MRRTEYIVPIDDESRNIDEIFIGEIRKNRELIRCRECKFLRLTGTVWKCKNRLVMMLCEPNDYCSRAERKGIEK